MMKFKGLESNATKLRLGFKGAVSLTLDREVIVSVHISDFVWVQITCENFNGRNRR